MNDLVQLEYTSIRCMKRLCYKNVSAVKDIVGCCERTIINTLNGVEKEMIYDSENSCMKAFVKFQRDS